MEKNFKQKIFSNFVCAPLGSRVNIYINFCLQVHFQVSAAWYCSLYLPPVSTPLLANFPLVSLIPVAICHRCRWHRCHQCQQDKGNWWKNLPPVSLRPVAICHWCRWYRRQFAIGVIDTGGAPWLANISANFRKNSKWPYCYFQGLGGRWFMKKTWSKTLVTLSL